MNNIEFKVKAADFMTAIKRVKHCMSDNEARRNLMGINLTVSETDLTRLNIMAADSFRIARQSIEVTADKPFNITVRREEVERMMRIPKIKDTDLQMIAGITEKHLTLIEENTVSYAPFQLNDYEYPTAVINRLLTNSESSANQIIINDVNSFYRAAEYIYYASDSCRQAVIKLILFGPRKDGGNDNKTVSLEMGMNINTYFRQAAFSIEAEGSNTKEHIGLNVRFLKEALKVFKTLKARRLILSYKDRESPCFLMADAWNDRLAAGYTFQQLILPVRLKY